jgi:hypothetical protein
LAIAAALGPSENPPFAPPILVVVDLVILGVGVFVAPWAGDIAAAEITIIEIIESIFFIVLD